MRPAHRADEPARVRRATGEDLSRVLALLQAAEPTRSAGETPREEDSADEWAEMVGDPDSLIFVAEQDDETVGFAWVRGRAIAQARVLVAPTRRRAGTGSALLSACIASARELGALIMTLHVWPHDERVVRHYESRGFKLLKILKNYRQRRNGESGDAYVMGFTFDG
jgi:ribosomal protein S18 acetylase RimI-like enzyme